MLVNLAKLVSKLESGSRPKGGVKNACNGIPSLGAEHLNSNGGFNFKKIKYVPEDFFASQNKGIIEYQDILVVKDGATTGKISFVDKNFPHKKASINEHVFKLSIKENLALPRFVFWYLRSDIGNRQILDDFRGATVGGISRGFVDKVRLLLPSIEEQKRIVRELDAADTLRQKRKQAIALLDDYLKAVFLKMFGDPVMNPKAWIMKPFYCLCLKILGGGTPSKANLDFYMGNIPWVTPKDMKKRFVNDSEDHISEAAVKNSSVKIIPRTSVLMVIRSGVLKHTLPVAINDVEVTINQDMKAYVIDPKVSNPHFVLFFFEVYQNHLLKKVRAVTADNLKFDDIKNIETILPPLKLQHKFAEIVVKIERLKQKMLTQSSELEINFNSLMQRVFNS